MPCLRIVSILLLGTAGLLPGIVLAEEASATAQDDETGSGTVSEYEADGGDEPPASDSEQPPGEEPDAQPPDEPVLRTPMVLPGYAPFGASQRGMPPVVNPAHPSTSDRRFRFGTLFDFGFGAEFGDADDDFVTRVEDLFDDFEDLEERAERFSDSPPSDSEIDEFLDALNAFEVDGNLLVRDLTERAWVKLTASASAPLVPIAIRSDTLRGTFTLNADGILEARGTIESSDDAFDFGLQGTTSDDIDSFELDDDDIPVVVLNDGTRRRIEPTDDAGVAVQGGMVGRAGIGYAREVWRNQGGRLHAGTTFNFFHTTLVRGGVLFNDDDPGDTARDEFEENQEASIGFGLDLGVAWLSDWYSAGATFQNINEPSFDYPDTGNSDFFNSNPQAKRNGSRWRMERQLTLEGALHTSDRRWIASGSLDVNAVTDTTGDDYQWVSILGSYEPGRTWVPSPRAGLRKNLTGEKLTYISAGLSFFRALHLDVASSLESITLDDRSVPRGLQANLALGRRF